jgi:hypothetical protein
VVTFCGHVFCQTCWQEQTVVPADPDVEDSKPQTLTIVRCNVCQNELHSQRSVYEVQELRYVVEV